MSSPESKGKYYCKETASFVLSLPIVIIVSAFAGVFGFLVPIIDWTDDYIFRMKHRDEIIVEEENPCKKHDYLPWLHKRYR